MSSSPARSNLPSSPQRLRMFPAAFSNPNNILTYKGGKLEIYPYPWGNTLRTKLKPASLLWKLFADNPTNAPHCFHNRPVRTFKIEVDDSFIAACCHSNTARQCNFWLNLTEIEKNVNGQLIAQQDNAPSPNDSPSSDDSAEIVAAVPTRRMLPQSSSPSAARTRRQVLNAAATRVRRPRAARSHGHQVGQTSASAPLPHRQDRQNAVASSSATTIDLTHADGDVRRILCDIPRIQLLRFLLKVADSREGPAPLDHSLCLPADLFLDKHRFCPACNKVMRTCWVRFHVCDLTQL